MNVKELREALQQLENDGQGEAEVLFSYNSGDYWRTQVAATIDTCEEGIVKYSEYHSMDKVVDRDEDDEEEEHTPKEGQRQVVLLG